MLETDELDHDVDAAGEAEPSMRVCEFANKMHAVVEQFKDYWIEQRQENPTRFPVSLPETEWFEQFVAWIERQEEMQQ